VVKKETLLLSSGVLKWSDPVKRVRVARGGMDVAVLPCLPASSNLQSQLKQAKIRIERGSSVQVKGKRPYGCL